MGIYATTTSIEHLLSNLYRDNNIYSDPGGEEMVSRAIERAEGTVNSYMSSRYELPFNPIPPEIRRLSEDVACYYVLRASRYRVGADVNGYITEFKSAFDTLKDIREGKMGLSYTDGSSVPININNTFLSSTDGYSQIFQLDEPTAWVVDSTQQDDIRKDRQ